MAELMAPKNCLLLPRPQTRSDIFSVCLPDAVLRSRTAAFRGQSYTQPLHHEQECCKLDEDVLERRSTVGL
ncbi:hypothetical protein FF1_021628 [Malus domestica]